MRVTAQHGITKSEDGTARERTQQPPAYEARRCHAPLRERAIAARKSLLPREKKEWLCAMTRATR